MSAVSMAADAGSRFRDSTAKKTYGENSAYRSKLCESQWDYGATPYSRLMVPRSDVSKHYLAMMRSIGHVFDRKGLSLQNYQSVGVLISVYFGWIRADGSQVVEPAFWTLPYRCVVPGTRHFPVSRYDRRPKIEPFKVRFLISVSQTCLCP